LLRPVLTPAIGVRMPTNDFKAFASAAGANILSQSDYIALAALSTGWQSGVAKSSEVNKAIRQATFIAAAIAQYVVELSDQDVLDDGNVANFITKLKVANSSQFFSKSNNLSDLIDRQAARSNLELGNAATRNVGAVSGTVSAGDDSRIVNALQASSNLSELTSPATARTNLELGNSATRNVGAAPGTIASGDDSRIINALQGSKNLSDLASAPMARSNLGLGNSALLNVGAAAGTVAAGNDSRITGAMQKESNLSDLVNITTARSNLGLGGASTQNVGTGANQIPDMNSFTSSPTTNGWFKFPSGLIIQYGVGGPLTPATPDAVIGFNITFPNKCLFITEHDLNNAAKKSEIQIGYVTNTGFTAFNIGVLDRNIPSGLQPPITTTVQWLAIGY